ncbi:Poly(ADP-ribose) polymerase catalytic domain protein, partial [Opisthorchis viverrini]
KNYKYVKRKRLFAKDSAPPPVGALSTHTVFVTDGPHDDGKSKAALVDECKALGAFVTEKHGLPPHPPKKKQNNHDNAFSHVVESKGSSSAFNSRDADDVIKCTFKGGAVVDPESGLESRASVMRDSMGKPMSAVLGMVDLVKGSNSFYRLQALQADTKASFWVFRAWGRIGTTIGGTKLEKFTTASAARQSFEDLYLEKTGNEWKDRANFQKKPHKFYEIELDYGEVNKTLRFPTQAEEKGQQMVPTKPSKLPPALQALIQFICDIESMKEAMIEFELDLRKMPLGKLSKRQIHEAFGVLSSLSALLDKKKKKGSPVNLDPTFLLSASTRFYTLIPHNFGMKAPPLLDNPKMIRDKLNMLDDLLEIELAYNILKEDKQSGEHPLDQHYKQLKTNLKGLRTNWSHPVTLEESRIPFEEPTLLKDERQQESCDEGIRCQRSRFISRTSVLNGACQKSQGLRIAPPEAPVTGYMFGKGIYFADMVSKAANYCFTNQSQPYGIMLLCEVILGDMDKCTHANGDPLPSQYHSRMGMGSVTPDPKSHYTNPEGVVYPIGEPIDSGVKNGSLIYNEYIVYDVAQVKQKYLVRVKFTY